VLDPVEGDGMGTGNVEVLEGVDALNYAVVTPARDEAENLARLASSVVAQTVRPSAWVVVDHGSDDSTREIAEQLAHQYDWVQALSLPGPRAATRGGPVVQALKAGLAQLGDRYEVVVKLDADVSFEPDYFACLLRAFRADSKLGIASGACFESRGGRWRRNPVTGTSVEGQCRAYRRQCLVAVSPLEERLGWDALDEMKANSLGWRTRTLRDLPFRHHRAVAARDASRIRAWVAQGEASYYMWYRHSYAWLRAIVNARRDPAALALAWGYSFAALRGAPRSPDPGVRRHVRAQQAWRRLPSRARESLGRG
jgi:glycosyltransferase involved in cell wall biosynthesis